MKRGKLIIAATAAAALALDIVSLAAGSAALDQQQRPSFRAGVDLVRVNAIVRDKKGQFVRDLRETDFEVLDNGEPRKISDFRRETGGVTVAVLIDVSGSMENKLAPARGMATEMLAALEPAADEAAVFMFDTRLMMMTPFTRGLKSLPAEVETIRPFGATSLHDAIAQTADKMVDRVGRRAVVVLSDGKDNASRMTAAEVSAKASAIDVPVYIVGLVPAIDNPTSDASTVAPGESPLAGPLADLARWTGGHTFVASTAADRTAVVHQILDELRHQYLISFESSGQPGWHPLVVRTRQKDLVVRARSGYHAGQSRPIS